MKRNGFTLVEVMVSAGLFSVILLVAYGVLQAGNTIYTRDSVYLDMQQQARNGMDRIIREAREAQIQTITVVNTNSDRISITTPNEVGIQYYLSGTNLIREYPSGTTKIVASNIPYLKFTLSGVLLQISIRADKTYGSQTISFSLVEKVRLRNE